MTEAEKTWIDGADYETLLRRWRFAPAGGDPIFQGETGKYYGEVMRRKRDEIGPQATIAAGKRVGW